MTRRRIVWITGAGSGVGKALAERFASNGDYVVLSGRKRKTLVAVLHAIRLNGGSGEVMPLDVLHPKSVQLAGQKILRAHRRVDVLVNNAGTTSFKSFQKTAVPEFEEVVATNLTGFFSVTKAVLASMLRRRSGIVLNILSYAAKTTYAGSAAYSASKSGAAAMMDVLREEMRGTGIRVVNVYPGAIDTPMWSKPVHKKFSPVMMTPWEVSSIIYESTVQKPNVAVEELVIRPHVGDLRV